MILTRLATGTLRYARSLGRLLGRELVVETSSHSIQISMEKPNKDRRAWDGDLYKRGQLYYDGYANPLKIELDHHPGIESKDTTELSEGEAPDDDDSEDSAQEEEVGRADVISSSRYQQFMQQNLISQLLNPKEQWDKIVYAVIAIAALQFVSIIVTLWATGTF
jgi:hypothetical protein